jgi:RNA polymerase sigma factor (sigma-70 family)
MGEAKYAKSRSGWASAVEQFRVGLEQYLTQRLHNTDSVEELAQEVFLRLLRVKDPNRVKSPQAYMYRVAVYTLHEFRAREDSSLVAYDSDRAEHLSERLIDDADSPERLLDQQAQEARIARVIRLLPPMQRKVLLMVTGQDLSHASIAKSLGVSVGTVRNHLYRALAFCRQRLTDQDTRRDVR